MTHLKELAKVIRSKNAGPHRLTYDIIFDHEDAFELFIQSSAADLENLATAIGVQAGDITSSHIFRAGKALKITVRRPLVQGALGERDVYGAQQHRSLMFLDVSP